MILSIITPNLNNAEYIEDNIISISKLKIDFEHIIIDGGSSDGSIDIIKKYPHVKLLHQSEKTGMYGAIDQGIKFSTGKYITWVNSDDRIITNGIEKIFLDNNIINTIRNNSRLKVIKKFTVNRMVNEYEELYKKIINNFNKI